MTFLSQNRIRLCSCFLLTALLLAGSIDSPIASAYVQNSSNSLPKVDFVDAVITTDNPPAIEEGKVKGITSDTLIAALDEDENYDENYASRIIDMESDSTGQIYFIREQKEARIENKDFLNYFYEKVSSVTGIRMNAPIDQENNKEAMTGQFKPGSIIYDPTSNRILLGGYDRYKQRTVIKAWQSPADILFSAPWRSMDWKEYASGNSFTLLDQQHALISDAASGTLSFGDASALKSIVDIPRNNNYSRRIESLIQDRNVYLFDTWNNTLSVVDTKLQKKETVSKIDLPAVSAVTAHNGAFYLASDLRIYKLTTTGELTEFVNLSDVYYNWGLVERTQPIPLEFAINGAFGPIKHVGLICFDHHNNLIVYDDAKKTMKRINLSPAPSSFQEWSTPGSAPSPVPSLRTQMNIDLLLPGTYDSSANENKSVDLAVGKNELLEIYRMNNLSLYNDLRQYNLSTGQLVDEESYSYSHAFIVNNGEKWKYATHWTPQNLAYNPYTEEIWVGVNYRNEQVTSFYSRSSKGKPVTYNINLSQFSANDFMVFTADGRFIYSCVANKTIYVENLRTSDSGKKQNAQPLSVDLTGKKTVAFERNGTLHVYDSGSKLLYAIDLSTGDILRKTTVEQELEYVTATPDTMLGIHGTKIYRIAETGASEEIADITTLPVDKTIYNAQKEINPDALARVTEHIQGIQAIAADRSGNLIIRDLAGVLWRVNLFE